MLTLDTKCQHRACLDGASRCRAQVVSEEFVLDTSVTGAWCFKDEASHASNALLQFLLRGKSVVPGLRHFETANMLLQRAAFRCSIDQIVS
jgi:hypothetical protein